MHHRDRFLWRILTLHHYLIHEPRNLLQTRPDQRAASNWFGGGNGLGGSSNGLNWGARSLKICTANALVNP